MALTGECEVPAHRCGEVIRNIATHLCRAVIPETDLPSQRSALRFVDRRHVISKLHIAETLMDNRWDLHSDGTSRSGKKYVGQQVTTEDGKLAMGFTAVAVENTTTLLEVAMTMLEELSDIFSPTAVEMQQNFLTMLQNLSGVMTDRAAVMKSFSRELDKDRQMLLQTDEEIQFLNCNAHFLLGMGTEAKEVLADVENTSGEKLGRDQFPRFNNFQNSTECSSFRYIRTACECLGPRGDDTNGCRDAWEAYCSMMGKQSKTTSFRENRLNNLFQAAASLQYHRQDIQNCLRTYLPKRNRKLDSIFVDSQCKEIHCQITAFGPSIFLDNGSLLVLVGQVFPYLEFYVYVKRLHTLLTEWTQDATPALEADWQPTFPGVDFSIDFNIFDSLRNITPQEKEKVSNLLQQVCQNLLAVTERQLADFLPGGRYFDVQDVQQWEAMKHSAATNLVGEQCFGDLDFSLFKRRNASLHHHPTIIC